MTATSRVRLGRAFNLLWAGQSVSYIGDKINLFVVPTVMILLLDASAFEVGVVGMAQWLAIPLLSMVAGVLVDRWDLRRTLVWCDLIRFAVIAVLPVAYWLDFLSVPLIFASVAVVSAMTVFFNIGYIATIAAIVPAETRVGAYSRMETSRTVSEVVGPAIAGGVYQLAGVFSLVVDAATYLFSAGSIRAMKPYGGGAGRAQPMWVRFKRGFQVNWNDRVLRGTMLATLLSNIGGPIFVTVMPQLAYRGLGLSAGTFGTVMSVAAVGAVVGALLTQKVSRLMGPARVMPWAIFLHSAVGLGVLAAPALPSAIVLGATLAAYGFTLVMYNVSTAAVRQVRVANEDQAVSQAAFRTVTWGIIPVAAFMGGVIVDALTEPVGVLAATKYTMVAATLIGTFLAWIPIVTAHRRITREEAAKAEAAGKEAEEVAAP